MQIRAGSLIFAGVRLPCAPAPAFGRRSFNDSYVGPEEGELVDRFLCLRVEQGVNLLSEGLYVLKVSVHACVPYICDSVEFSEPVHYRFTYGVRRYLGQPQRVQIPFDLADQLINAAGRQWAFRTRLKDAYP